MKTIAIHKIVSTAVQPSPRVLQTAAMFGLGVDEERALAIVPHCEIPLPHLSGRSGIVFVTGPSGSGKSTILTLVVQQCKASSATRVYELDALPALPDVPLVDALDWPNITLEQVMSIFALVGLSDAFVMLRRPRELSDGQRARLRLAHVIAQSLHDESNGQFGTLIVADEFCATLDRITAQTICRNIRRWINRHASDAITFLCATTHDDVLEALQPDVLVWKKLGDEIEVMTR